MLVQSNRLRGSLPWLIAGLSLSLYASAFVAPYPSQWYSRGILIFWAELFYFWWPLVSFAWWSNVGYWVALAFFCRREWAPAATYGLFSVGLASTWLLLDHAAIQAPAFPLWVGSMATLTLGAFLELRHASRVRTR